MCDDKRPCGGAAVCARRDACNTVVVVAGSVTHVSLSNDGGCLLASSLVGDGRLFLLEKASGELLNSYVGHKNESYHIGSCFSNTDAYVASGSEDGSIVFWDLVEVRSVSINVAPLRASVRGIQIVAARLALTRLRVCWGGRKQSAFARWCWWACW